MDRLISRQAVLKQLRGCLTGGETEYQYVKLHIDSISSVTQKSGVWVEIDDEPHEVWECDHCGFVIDGSGCIDPYDYRDTYKFCPNCGCRMFETQEISERNLKMWHDIYAEEKRRERSDKE